MHVLCMCCRQEAATGVAIVRPPGHHAESNMAMGFCFFNNAAIAARAAQVCLSLLLESADLLSRLLQCIVVSSTA